MSEETPVERDDAQASELGEIQAEVDRHFEGSWERFLKAVRNPSEIMHFVLHNHCGVDQKKFEAWAEQVKLPPDWVPRFYGMLTVEGELKASAEAPEDVN